MEPDPAPPSDSAPPLTSPTPQTPEAPPEPQAPPSATPDSDSKTLSSSSSSESSEDEDDREEGAEPQGQVSSILPSSVLDKAGAIAQHFTSSIKRGSVSQDDGRSLGCASPRLPSRNSSSLSLGAEPADQRPELSAVAPEQGYCGSTVSLGFI